MNKTSAMNTILASHEPTESSTREVANHPEIIRLQLLAQEIQENPSQLRAGFKHKDAPSTPDFDFNVFAERIDTMMDEDRVKNNPWRKAQLALSALQANLTYDNRNRAKKLIKELMVTLERREDERRKQREEDKQYVEEFNKHLRVSTALNDEFWQKVAKPAKSEAIEALQQAADRIIKERRPVLEKEKARYQQLIAY